jgi:molybdate transport system regulatory protein
MDATVDAQLRADDVSFTAADAELLRAVAEAGSVSGATDALGRSRARALGRIETLEDGFGTLVERRRGGAGGGGSELTVTARQLLARFDRLEAALAGTASVDECVIRGTVTDVDGELCVVETDAGEVRARIAERPGQGSPAVGSTVQVGVRSDAVTLHAPTDAPEGDATSARNRFAGTVTAIDRETTIGRVTVDVGTAEPLVALLTEESFERLALSVGDEIVASFKATATRAIRAE